MNNVCICVGKRANTPFTPKFSEFSLYSIEELCYYFIERSYVIHEDIVSMELVDWIRDECELPELANSIEIDVKKRVSAAIIVSTILEYTRIYDEETVKRTEHILKEQASLQPIVRWKNRADFYYGMGRFRQAFEIYYYVLETLGEEDSEDKAIIYYNLASIFALDFDYEKACEYYEKSYEQNALQETRVAYILAKKMATNDYEFGQFMRQNPQWENEFALVLGKLEAANEKWEQSRTKEIMNSIHENKEGTKDLIRNLKKDYRRQTYLNK